MGWNPKGRTVGLSRLLSALPTPKPSPLSNLARGPAANASSGFPSVRSIGGRLLVAEKCNRPVKRRRSTQRQTK